MSDATQKCPVCGAVNPARAKFCGECGAAFRSAAPAPGAAAATRTGNPVLPWFLAGCAALAVHAVVIILALKGGINPAGSGDMTNAGSNVSGAQGPFATSSGRPTDLSQMTPREAADRLWNRVMTAESQGDTGQVNFFAPMTIQAYAQVTPIDPDARLHIGMINLIMNEPDKAKAQGDTIARENPTHLFGSLLRAEAAERAGQQAAARTAWRAFLANWDAEMRKNLDEYQQHKQMLDEDKTRAQQAGR